MRLPAALAALVLLAGIPGVRAAEPAAAAGDGDAPGPQVIAMSFAGRHRAYPLEAFERPRVLNDVLGRQEVAVFHDPVRRLSRAWFRTIFGEPIEFSGEVVGTMAEDLTTITRWDLETGEAVAGGLVGQHLVAVPITLTSWEALKARFPDAQLFSSGQR